MAKTPYLKWREGRAYYRRRVPVDLIEAYGGDCIDETLDTSSKTEARKRVAFKNAQMEARFVELREQIELANDNPDQLSTYDDDRLSGIALRWLDHKAREDLRRKAKDTQPMTEDEWRECYINLEIDLQEIKEAVKIQDAGPGMTIAGNWLEEMGVTYDPKSETFRKLGFYMNQTILERAQETLREAKGLQVISKSSLMVSQGVSQGQKIGKAITVEELFEQYLSDPARKRNYKTHENYKFTVRVLQEILGPKTYIHTITRDQCMEVRDFLIKMPSNASKKFPGLSLKAATQKAIITGAPPLSPKSINKYMMQLSTVLNFARKNLYIAINVAESLYVHDPVADIDKRPPFVVDDLKSMFVAPLYTGCIDDGYNFKKTGPNIIRKVRFWLPLIGAFTGMRLNEVCQLEVDDIRYEEGVPIMDVRRIGKEGEKQVKTKDSIRIVPVHPELQKVGFLEYVDEMRKKGNISIFPELKPKKGQYKSDCMSQKINRFFKSLGLKETKPAKDFHSFRGTVATALKKAKVPGDAIDEICGWAKQGTRQRHYEQHYSPKERYEFICGLKYDSLDLSHLYVGKNKIK